MKDFQKKLEGYRSKNIKNYNEFVLSLLVHALVFSALMYRSSNYYNDVKPKPEVFLEPIEIEWQTKNTKQIVETEKVEKSKEAEKDAYLGEQTQIVKKQTRAQETGRFAVAQKSGAKSLSKKKDQASPKENSLEIGELKKIGLSYNLAPTGHLSPQQRAQSYDYLDKVQKGQATLLNTKEFAYFSFYQRVRNKLEQYWEPSLQQKLEKFVQRGRTIAEDREHSTKLMVYLNQNGEITKVKVEDSSGFLDLDEAATEAFNKAGPFPNPPKGMIDVDGYVRIEWEFVLKT